MPPPLAIAAVTILLASAIGAGAAAEQPLGVVVDTDAQQQLVVRFDASVHLLPGAMLAVYGPGKVEKHPLTKEVIVEARKLVAKIQSLTPSNEDGKVRARVTWSDGTPLSAGLDVVPLPGEAAPNSPPVLGAGTLEFSAPAEGSVRVRLPISDPDGDALSFSWALQGASGQAGVLDARTGCLPEVGWTAPGTPGTATLAVVARDPFGQRLELTVKLVAKDEEDLRKRELHAFAGFGGELQPSFARLARDADGVWVGIDAGSAAVVRLVPGWTSRLPLAFPPEHLPRRPLAVHVHHHDIYVLDGKKQAVVVFAQDGTPRREFGQFQSASDFALAPDGVAYIADQAAGGVLVYEANGKFRSRLGHADKGDDGFTGLTRIALAASGELYCLDAAQGQIQRFDRFQHRLETWALQLDPRNPPLDLALHPKGLLVLLTSGQILQVNAKGVASESWKGLSECPLVERPGSALCLAVDAGNEAYVAYSEGLLARYSADGVVSGVRGAGLWGFTRFAADGLGRLFALDPDYGYIYQYDGEGFRVARLGGLAKGGGPLAKPVALAASPDGSALSVLDAGQSGVVRFNLRAPAEKPLLFGQPGKNNGQFQDPIAVAMDGLGRTYVLDAKQHRVQVFDAGGAFLYLFGHYDHGKLKDELSEPLKLAVDPRGTAAYVYDDDTYEIKKFALDAQANSGSHVNNSGGKGDGPGQLRAVQGMGCDRLGLLYVIDSSRGDLQLMDFRGSNAIVGPVRKAADLGVRKLESLALAPDGQFYLFYDGSGVAWRW
jgi:DNA-binding beta-propeller fold protein YncE